MSIPQHRLALPIDVGLPLRDLATVGRRAASLAGMVALHVLELTLPR